MMSNENKNLIMETLRYCKSYGKCDECPSFSKCEDHGEDCARLLAKDALELLKEQKEQKPTVASIEFLPVCSNCGKIITNKVDCVQSDYVPLEKAWLFNQMSYIEPEKCPSCGSYFESIVMPTKLPFTRGGLIKCL